MITAKINNITKRGHTILSFQRADKNRTLNIQSICNYSEDLLSVSYG